MSIKIGINGFGRIGRLVLRAAIMAPDRFTVCAVNDPFISTEYMAYMLKYDTVHGRFDHEISFSENSLIVDGNTIRTFSQKEPSDIPWKEAGAALLKTIMQS